MSNKLWIKFYLYEHAVTPLKLSILRDSTSTIDNKTTIYRRNTAIIVQPTSSHTNISDNEIAILMLIIFIFFPFMGLFVWWMAR